MELTLQRYPKFIVLNDGTSVMLRPLQGNDTQKLLNLFRDVPDEELRMMRDDVTDPHVLRSWTEDINYDRVLPIVAELDGQLIGEASLHRNPKMPHSNIGQMRIYVSHEFRHRGLGSRLIDDVIELARDCGLEKLVLELFIDNAAMISAFERRGFERDAILPVYQLVIMCYNLATRPGRDALAIAHADKLPPRPYWPDLLFDQELFEIADEINLTELLLDDIVEAGWGHRPAIYFRDEIVTYDLLLSEVKRLASSLARLGIKAGDPVWLHLPNFPQAIAANFAIQRLGALSVPTPPQFSSHELEFIAAESGAVAAITTKKLLPEVLRTRAMTDGPLKRGAVIVQGLRESPVDTGVYSYARLISRGKSECPVTLRHRNEIGLLLYTSADSGHPRGTSHRLDGLLSTLDAFGRFVWRINEEDIIGSLAPLGFAQGFLTFGLMPFRFGASVALPSEPLADHGSDLVDAIRRHRVSVLFAPPTTYRQILADQSVDVWQLASLRLCCSGGEPLTVETYAAWEERFEQPIFEGFGTTEMLYAFLSNAVDLKKPRPGSLGQAVPGYEVKIVGDLGNELQTGEIGFLLARGPTGTLYWNNPDSQRKSVRNGWNMPGDYAYKDAEGYFWYVSRSDDLIKTRSYRIDPNEVEAAICEYPRIKEAAVIGLPDEMRGQRPVAYAVPFDPLEADELMARAIINSLKGRVADYKIPDEVIFVDDLPRNAQGQLLRRTLREKVRRQRTTST